MIFMKPKNVSSTVVGGLSIIGRIVGAIGEGLGYFTTPYNDTTNVVSVNNQTEEEKVLSWTQPTGASMAALVVVVAIVGCLYKICFYQEVGDSKTDSTEKSLSDRQEYNEQESINISMVNLQLTDHDSNYDSLLSIPQTSRNYPDIVISHIIPNLQSDSGVSNHSNGEESLIDSISASQEADLMGVIYN
ncbi:hypothetical protein [Candidatus Tisiphia endosymbiont of Hybos culiciformis]|uniref:hypothetical protein n=1 Tax=Candidatus Tisiphia endosymbiont of Hybos culiciformis TaxID=3139331 RepID=UPI003CCAA6F7